MLGKYGEGTMDQEKYAISVIAPYHNVDLAMSTPASFRSW